MTLDDNAALTVDRRDFSIHWITLRFRGAELEDQFAADNYTRQIAVTRVSMVMGAFVFSLFGILDVYIVPDVFYEAWLLRFGLVCPILFGLVVLSYTGHITYRNSGWFSLAMIAPSASVVTLTAIAEAPGAYFYYAGLIVVIAYSNCVWRLSYLYSTAMSLTTVIAYEWVILFVNPVPFEIFANNNAFMGSAVGISMFLNYVQERQLRVSFVDNEKLRFEQLRSERLLSRSEVANRSKNDFLAIMSHELRTPLNAIIGFSEIISSQMFGPVGQSKYVDYASDIRSSGAHLLSIINDILDISKAEAGKLQLEEEPLDPVESLNRTMRMFRQRASELGVDLTFRVRDDLPWIIVDPRLFNQVAINLTSNALKFTPEGGQVRVELGLDSTGDMVLNVEDTGIGIKTSDLTRIFEPFEQVEDAMSRTQQGTGLGLPLVRKIMSLHGGTVELKSHVGEGTTVTATFPKSRFVAPDVDDLKRHA
ncbi:MAG: HAMP domain-containing sensor histidine kinase [Parvibaculum sp.]|uniref:sensor histidine kinase n=1 Tax=Parvibaculum sp. TaxID=2024848 RepID=UPI0034A06997